MILFSKPLFNFFMCSIERASRFSSLNLFLARYRRTVHWHLIIDSIFFLYNLRWSQARTTDWMRTAWGKKKQHILKLQDERLFLPFTWILIYRLMFPQLSTFLSSQQPTTVGLNLDDWISNLNEFTALLPPSCVLLNSNRGTKTSQMMDTSVKMRKNLVVQKKNFVKVNLKANNLQINS